MSSDAAIVGLRRLLCVTYLIGAVGTTGELLLMEHTEGRWQWLPILVIGASVVLSVIQALVGRWWLVRGFQVLMVLILVTALIGVWLHFDGKAEFKLEIDPSLKGWDLVWACIHGHSLPPVFAPGSMVVLGLLGMAWSYQNPALVRPSRP